VANPPDYGFTSTPDSAQQQQQASGGNGLAVAGLVLGIISLPAFFLTIIDIPIALLGIIFGGVGLAKAKKLNGKNKGMAMAGLICGIIGLIACVAYTIFIFMFVSKEIDREFKRHRDFGSMVEPAQSPVVAGDPCVYTLAEHG